MSLSGYKDEANEGDGDGDGRLDLGSGAKAPLALADGSVCGNDGSLSYYEGADGNFYFEEDDELAALYAEEYDVGLDSAEPVYLA